MHISGSLFLLSASVCCELPSLLGELYLGKLSICWCGLSVMNVTVTQRFELKQQDFFFFVPENVSPYIQKKGEMSPRTKSKKSSCLNINLWQINCWYLCYGKMVKKKKWKSKNNWHQREDKQTRKRELRWKVETVCMCVLGCVFQFWNLAQNRVWSHCIPDFLDFILLDKRGSS